MARSEAPYPRDMVGYGARPPDPQWPGGANLCLTIAVNYEAGGENSILHGDSHSEGVLTDTGFPPYEGVRNMIVESAFEYGSRRGFWRLMRILEERNIKTSVWAVVMGLERNPEAAQAIVEGGHEVVSHGWRWFDYQHVPEDVERQHIRRAVEGLERMTGERPVGWMTGRPSPNTRRLLVEEGGFPLRPRFARRRAPLLGSGWLTRPIWSSRFPTRPTTTATTSTPASSPPTTSSPT